MVPFEHPAKSFLFYSNRTLITSPSIDLNFSGKKILTRDLYSQFLSNIRTSDVSVHTRILVSLFLSTN